MVSSTSGKLFLPSKHYSFLYVKKNIPSVRSGKNTAISITFFKLLRIVYVFPLSFLLEKKYKSDEVYFSWNKIQISIQSLLIVFFLFFFLNREGRGKGVWEKEGSLLKFSVDMLSCTFNYQMAGVMITLCSTGDKIGNLYIQICNYNQLQWAHAENLPWDV